MITAAVMTGTCAYCPRPIARWNKTGKCNEHKNKGKRRGHAPYHPMVGLLRNCRQRAKAGGYPCTITMADVPPMPRSCTCCNRFMHRYPEEWAAQPSLDRIVPDLGYVPGNIAWICRRCNQVKSNATLDELRLVVAYMEAA